jgi:hypothetical protein
VQGQSYEEVQHDDHQQRADRECQTQGAADVHRPAARHAARDEQILIVGFVVEAEEPGPIVVTEALAGTPRHMMLYT